MKSLVSLVKCETYDYNEVKTAINTMLNQLGGMDKYMKSGQKVLVKANLLGNYKVDSATTTHPAVIRAIVEELMALGCDVTIGDSSGGTYSKSHMFGVYKGTGMAEVAEQTGCKLNDNFNFTTVKNDGGVVSKSLEIIDCVVNADVVINVAKLKTHSFALFTGCVKNLFGVIPGLQKVQMHSQHPELNKFMNFVVDIEECIKDKVVLNIIDGVIGMEGAGPSAGTPKQIGRIIGSANGFATDYVALKIVGKEPMTTPEFQVAKERGLTPICDDEVEIVGESVENSLIKDFKHIPMDRVWDLKKHFTPFVKWLSPYPYVKKSQCKGCEKCKNHCPKEAISMKKGVATFDLDKCIRCYCCQELCPFQLIEVKTSLLAKIIHKV